MGCVYNIPPVRSKDLPYVDVLSEAINNPIRMLAGWFIVTSVTVALSNTVTPSFASRPATDRRPLGCRYGPSVPPQIELKFPHLRLTLPNATKVIDLVFAARLEQWLREIRWNA